MLFVLLCQSAQTCSSSLSSRSTVWKHFMVSRSYSTLYKRFRTILKMYFFWAEFTEFFLPSSPLQGLQVCMRVSFVSTSEYILCTKAHCVTVFKCLFTCQKLVDFSALQTHHKTEVYYQKII